jgi:adenylate kinase
MSSKSTGKIYNIYPDCAPNPPEGHPEEDLVQRDDDTEEVVRNRLVQYRDMTAPLIDYYEEKGILENVDTDQCLEDIVESVKEMVTE